MNILIVAAHPDDEVLGAGATIARHAKAGDRVTTLILATGLDSRGQADSGAHRKLRAQADKAAAIVGTHELRFANFPDNRMDSVALLDVVKTIEDVAGRGNPEIVYTHCARDLNVDHEIAARAVVTAFRPQPGASAKRILSFDVPSATDWNPAAAPFAPTTFIDAGDTLDTKLKAMACYEEELRPFPHARSLEAIRARAVAWGTHVGLAAAEPFELLREIVR
jgi:LmbE family N-acetylglucosaminyl deacetylase